MSLILRVDVDKPYGRATVKEKILSKLCEEYWFPKITSFGYLYQLKHFLTFLAEHKIKAHLYFRKCTLPPKNWISDLLFDDHKLGFHVENSRDFNSFKNELEEIQFYFYPKEISSFTKHGSGKWKSGRNHHALYEPKKYIEWSKIVNIPFLFGNDEIHRADKINDQNLFFPAMFWIDKNYNDCDENTLKWVIDSAKQSHITVIIHPCNFIAIKKVENNMKQLISFARQQNVSWVTL